MKCINKNLEPIKELLNDFKEPVLSKILDSFPDDYIPTKEEALKKYSELLGSSVDYKLKVINALQSDKVRQPNKNFQGFLNDLQKQGVPKDQIELLNQVYQEGNSKEDLAIKLASNYSFSVEINTAKNQSIDLRNSDFARNTGLFDEEELAPSDEPGNTQYYSNLTVPGGTNGSYREMEISTPLITPSIRGHAEFATENGIGWFRSDDRQSNSTINSQNNDEKKEKKIKPNDTWRDVYRKIDNDLLRMPVDEVLDFINEAKEFLNNSKDAQNKEQYLEKLSVQEKAVKEELKLKKAAQENGRSYIEPSSWNAPNYDGNTNTYGHVTSSKALFDIIFGNGELDVNYTQDGKLIYLNKGGEGQAARIRINGSFGLVNLIFDAELLKEAGIEIHKGIEAHTRENIPLKYLTKKSKKFVLDAILNELDRRGEKLTDEQAQKIAESLGYNSWKELQQDLKDTSTGLEQKPIKNSSDNSKTRRILEVQSDLFQKGRASDLLVNTLNRNRKDNIRILELNNISYDRELTKEEQDELKKLNEPNFNEKGNQFLQLLNKDNNWVKFFVQSIIQDSAKQTVMEAREEDIKAKVRELENSGLLKIKCD